MLKIAPKALHFIKFNLPCGVSPRLLFHTKIILATFIVSLLVYIFQMCVLDLQILLIVSLLSSNI